MLVPTVFQRRRDGDQVTRAPSHKCRSALNIEAWSAGKMRRVYGLESDIESQYEVACQAVFTGDREGGHRSRRHPAPCPEASAVGVEPLDVDRCIEAVRGVEPVSQHVLPAEGEIAFWRAIPNVVA